MSITLGQLLLGILVAALVITGIMAVINKRNVQNWLITFLQNYCGALFIFSGLVKAVDPMGTAFKMEQYFAEFESTFSETAMSFIAPIFPWFSESAIVFSVFMIVLEIVLGIMLIIGSQRKLTAWLFFLIVVFFTFLTGFTYLTGYVPQGVNFFEFGKWGDWVETSMKVTDCGCFGDFLKLKPKVSFMKDLALLVPSILFLFKHQQMHQFMSTVGRSAIVGLTTVGLIIYCLSNYVWDIPGVDFRPFNVGKDIRTQRQLEIEAENAVEITAYRATNKASGKVVEIPYTQYLKEFKKYPKEEWDLDQLKTEPTVPRTKISDFDVSNDAGESVTDEILNHSGYSFMIVAYKIKYNAASAQKEITEQVVSRIDTLLQADTIVQVDTIFQTNTKTVETKVFSFDNDYLDPWTNTVNPILEAAAGEGVKNFAITAYADPAMLEAFKEQTNADYPFYTADDIMLKTIIRSNPGVVLMKDGKIIMKWHHKQLPDFGEIKAEYMK